MFNHKSNLENLKDNLKFSRFKCKYNYSTFIKFYDFKYNLNLKRKSRILMKKIINIIFLIRY